MAKLYLISVRDRGQDSLRPTGQWYWTSEDQASAVARLRGTGRYNSVVQHDPIDAEVPEEKSHVRCPWDSGCWRCQ